MNHQLSLISGLFSVLRVFSNSLSVVSAALIGLTLIALSTTSIAQEENEQPFGAAVLIIELTDNDIELQAFVDGVEWKRLQVFDPNERRIFNLRAQRKLRRQGGLSELFFASEPTHYLEDEPDFDGTIEEFLARFPAGKYAFEGTKANVSKLASDPILANILPALPEIIDPVLDGEALPVIDPDNLLIEGLTANTSKLESKGILTHILPALPEIIAPVSDGEDPPVIDKNNLVIEWESVTTRFIGDGSVEIIEYQVILDQVGPKREIPWVDGHTRRALINLPGSVTRLKVPAEFLLPDSQYEFEVLAIEKSGNSTISTGEFVTE